MGNNFIMSAMPNSPRTPQKLTIRNLPNRNAAFREYKQRTGAWPVFSIVMHVMRYVLMFVIVSALFWYGRLHAGSATQVSLGFLLLAPLFILLWTLLESLIWNYELRRKQLTSRGTFLTIKQFPGD